MSERGAAADYLDEATTSRLLSWLAWNMKKHGKSIFLLEDLQPSWLVPASQAYFLIVDVMLGLAIALISAPVAIVIETVFAQRHDDASSIIVAALVTGASVGALMHWRSYARHQSLETERTAMRRETMPAAAVEKSDAPSTVILPAKKKGSGCGIWGGCLPVLSFGGVLIAGALTALSFLQSEDFARTVGRGRLLAVIFVLLIFLLQRAMERTRRRTDGRFIRTAETIGVSWRDGLRTGLIALLFGGIVTFVAARFLDGWFGNRGVIDVGLHGRAPSFGGDEDVGHFLFGLSVPGRSLFAFLWAAVVMTAATLGSLRPRVVELKTRPNEGMRLSIRNATRAFFTIGVPVAVTTIALLILLPGASDHSAPQSFRATSAQLKLANERALQWVNSTPPPGSTADSVRLAVAGGSLTQSSGRDTIVIARARRIIVGFAVHDLLQRIARQPAILRDPRSLGRLDAALLAQLQGYGVFDDTSSLMPIAESNTPVRATLGVVLIFGLALGGAAGGIGFLVLGGMGVVRHYVLRLFLERTPLVPRDYVRFLDISATELGFLQKVGGGYVFMHRYLLEHFANMSAELGVLEQRSFRDENGLWRRAAIIATKTLQTQAAVDVAIRTQDDATMHRLEISGAIWEQKPARIRIAEYGDTSSEILCESEWCRGRRGFVANDRLRIQQWVFRPNPVATDAESDAANRPRADVRCPQCGWNPSPVNRWQCGTCSMEWDTFATRAVCPQCSTPYPSTHCLSCKQSSAHVDWYLNGAVTRTLSPADFKDTV